jgi:superfamily I DNA/RNA helicase
MSWLIPPCDLSSRQQQAVELPPDQPRLIVGPPGSGKTQILLHRAAFLRDTANLSPDGYRVFVFTNVLKDYIRAVNGSEKMHRRGGPTMHQVAG